tara:strand:+ start:165 stop:539 length:375 start_codon:yes stop_codon:yes gene_type:complete
MASIDTRKKLTISTIGGTSRTVTWADNHVSKTASDFDLSRHMNPYTEGSTDEIRLSAELNNNVINHSTKARPDTMARYKKSKAEAVKLAVLKNKLNDVRIEREQAEKNKKRNAKRRAKAKANKA